MEYNFTSIILNKCDVGETDRIYTMYTLEKGKIRSLAKGIRKPQAKLAGHLENFYFTEITVMKTRGIGKITSSVVEKHFPSLRRDDFVLTSLFNAFDKFNRLVDLEHKDEQIFLLLLEYLETLDSLSLLNHSMGVPGFEEKVNLLYGAFLFKLLDNLGYASEVRCCCECGGELLVSQQKFYSIKSGGVLCIQCAQTHRSCMAINNETIKLIRLVQDHRLSLISKVRATRKEIDMIRVIAGETLTWII